MPVFNINDFCAGREDARTHLHTPFSDDEFTYATDRKLIIRIKRVPGITNAIPSDIQPGLRSHFKNAVKPHPCTSNSPEVTAY